jgi:ubiquinone/menaquinone biosynthesis C-methylase UbiE
MTEIDKKFAGSIPQFYDSYMVPLIFSAYADDMADRVVHLEPASVLEIAAGSGVVPRALAPRLADSVRYIATDLNQAMLDHAERSQPASSPVEWRQADALHLPFEDVSFDTVICQFGAMFFPDRPKGYREARRVLKPGGTFIFSVWDHIRENEFAGLATEAAGQIFPDYPPLFLARTPHGYHDADRISDELRQSGFKGISVHVRADISRAPSPRHPAIAYCQGTPLRNEIEERDASKLQATTDRAESLIAAKFGWGAVEGKIQALVFTANRD